MSDTVPRRRQLLTLRLRLALTACCALAPVLTAACVAGVLLQHAELDRATSQVVDQQAESVRRAVRGVPDDELARAGSPVAGYLTRESTVVQVVTDAGQVLASSPGTDSTHPLLPEPDLAARRGVIRGVETGEQDRYAATALPVPSRRIYVVVATSLEAVDAATASTTRLLAVGAPALVSLVGLLAFWLAGRALRPVEAMRLRASQASATDLSLRLPVPRAADEVGRLGATLNDLLERIQGAQGAQRQFVADASHELRSPIAALRTLHEVAREDPEVDWPTVSAETLGETARLERLVADLLALARLDAGGDRRRDDLVDLTALVRTECARARRVSVSCTLAEGLRTRGDRDALGRAVRNLLDNAERYAVRSVWVGASLQHGSVVVHVVDDGPGIAVEDREHVFDRFVRLDESRSRGEGGTGLGLAIARTTVVAHGGRLTVVGEGPGADLELVLPAV